MNEWWPHSLAAWNITLHYAVQQSVHTVQYSKGAQCLHGILSPATHNLQATSYLCKLCDLATGHC